MKIVKIIPTVLTNDPVEAKELILKAELVVDRVQIDTIDGIFANNKTIIPETLADIDTKLIFDYHLMVNEPINWVEKAIRGQGDRIIGQVEKMSSQAEFISEVVKNGLQVGLGIDIDTPVANIDESVVRDLDVILALSVKAGFGGEDFFNLVAWDKIGDLVKLRNKTGARFKICVDGGVTKELIVDMEKSGVDEVAIGKRILEGDLKENIELITGGNDG